MYLVGAGPGDPGLISVKGKDLLEKADCIIYDYLANPVLLAGLSCELIYAGKKGSDHTMPQEEINDLIVAKAKEGKTVVRLKGGDPYIFGRGGEEAERLKTENIPFSVVPGISSFYAALSYAGIPLTHRDFVSAFEVITGHRKDDSAESINYPDYRAGKSFVFMMGVKNLALIAQDLISSHNFPPDIPAAAVSRGTTPLQKSVTGTLSDIAAIAESAGITPPAIIVIGEVVRLRDTLGWYENLPLYGKRIAVTRTREQASDIAERFTAYGAEVIEFPTIAIADEGDSPELRAALEHLRDYSWVVFTSQNAVSIFFRQLFLSGKDSRALSYAKIAAIGESTAHELFRYGLRADLVPEKFVAEELLRLFAKVNPEGEKILLPCSADARPVLKQGLELLGAAVDRIHIYRTARPEHSREIAEKVFSADIITFASSSAVNNFFGMADSSAAIASIGPVTSEAVRAHGHDVAVEAEEYSIDGLVEAVVKKFGRTQ
ncbi:MAG: uroporphyrinogen-III C-methyltransferase [Spirochaetota bacterium]